MLLCFRGAQAHAAALYQLLTLCQWKEHGSIAEDHPLGEHEVLGRGVKVSQIANPTLVRMVPVTDTYFTLILYLQTKLGCNKKHLKPKVCRTESSAFEDGFGFSRTLSPSLLPLPRHQQYRGSAVPAVAGGAEAHTGQQTASW